MHTAHEHAIVGHDHEVPNYYGNDGAPIRDIYIKQSDKWWATWCVCEATTPNGLAGEL